MVTLENEGLVLQYRDVDPDARLRLSFQRTLRVPDDGREYPLPAGLGSFPLRHVEDCAARLPASIRRRGGVLLPMHQAEALWIHFHAQWPMAVQVGTGKVCAVTGGPWRDDLVKEPQQNYVPVPDQPWLDGYAVERGRVRQFVAMPLGRGLTMEEQITGEAEWGGIQLQAFPLRREVRERERAKHVRVSDDDACYALADHDVMGLSPGGLIRQEIYEDARPAAHWDQLFGARVFVHLLNSRSWRAVTGEAPPPSPITRETYRKSGIPWFDHYREDLDAVPGGAGFGGTHSLGELGVVEDPDGGEVGGPVVPTGTSRRPREVKQGEF